MLADCISIGILVDAPATIALMTPAYLSQLIQVLKALETNLRKSWELLTFMADEEAYVTSSIQSISLK